MKGWGAVTRPSRGWGDWVPFWPQAWPWEGDKLWILIINAASATPVTATEGGKGVRAVGGWEENRENRGTEGQGESGFGEQQRPVWLRGFPGGYFKRHGGRKEEGGTGGDEGADLEREGNEKSTHPETLKKSTVGRGQVVRLVGREACPTLVGKRKKTDGLGPRGLTPPPPPHPLDTPPSDPGPEERVQSQQTAETHGLRAGGGAAPRRAWYGGRAGSRAPDRRGEGTAGARVQGRGRPGPGGGGDKVSHRVGAGAEPAPSCRV